MKKINFFKRVVWLVLPLLTLFNISAWGATTITDAVYTFGSSSTPSGWTVSSSNTHATGYLKFSSGDYVEMSTSSIFASGEVLFSDNIKVEVSCGTFGTWSGDCSVKCTVALLNSSGSSLSSAYETFSSLSNSEGTYRTAINVSRPIDPSAIAKLRITFTDFTTGPTLRVKNVKLNYQTASATAYTVSFSTGTGNPTLDDRAEARGGVGITLPTALELEPACSTEGWFLYGWASASYSESTSAPTTTFVGLPGAHYEPTSDITLYAVYKQVSGGTGAAIGEAVWAESFVGYSEGDKPSSASSNATVFGDATINYAYTDGDGTSPGTTRVMTSNIGAGGVSPELIIGKKGTGGTTGGSFSVSGIPTGDATTLTLSYKKNNKAISVAITGTGYILGDASGSGPYTHTITCGSASTFGLTFTGTTTDNVRMDDFTVSVATSSNAAVYTYTSNPICVFDNFIDIMHDNVIERQSETYSMPSPSDASKGSLCEGEHYHFLGWVEESYINDDGTLKAGATLYPAGDSGHTANNKTFYAIWAKEE